MNITRPLLSLDLETTGTDLATDRIVEIGLVRLDPDGTRRALRILVNPERPIPAAATAIHGISDADVEGARPFRDVAVSLCEALDGCDLVTFNGRAFDVPILRAEFDRAGFAWPCEGARIIDAFVLYREHERHTLVNAVRLYCDRDHTGAHHAVDDAAATLDVLMAQVGRYPDLAGLDVAALDAASGGRRPDWATPCGRVRWDSEGCAVWGFGKLNGKLVASDRGFAAWVLRNTFPDDVKALVGRVLRGEQVRRAA